jgi:hypothetical protein
MKENIRVIIRLRPVYESTATPDDRVRVLSSNDLE